VLRLKIHRPFIHRKGTAHLTAGRPAGRYLRGKQVRSLDRRRSRTQGLGGGEEPVKGLRGASPAMENAGMACGALAGPLRRLASAAARISAASPIQGGSPTGRNEDVFPSHLVACGQLMKSFVHASHEKAPRRRRSWLVAHSEGPMPRRAWRGTVAQRTGMPRSGRAEQERCATIARRNPTCCGALTARRANSNVRQNGIPTGAERFDNVPHKGRILEVCIDARGRRSFDFKAGRDFAAVHGAVVPDVLHDFSENLLSRTRRGWAIAARCVVGVVWHISVWLGYRRSLSAAMPSHQAFGKT
jgi:hypothetical protein